MHISFQAPKNLSSKPRVTSHRNMQMRRYSCKVAVCVFNVISSVVPVWPKAITSRDMVAISCFMRKTITMLVWVWVGGGGASGVVKTATTFNILKNSSPVTLITLNSAFKHISLIHSDAYFVCVEVLRPSQPNGVMSSAVGFPNHTLLGRFSPLSG